MPTSTDKTIGNPIFNVLTRSIYDSITPNADEFYLITDDAPITAGTGLTASMSGGSVVIDHTNSITAQTTQAIYPLTFDSEGHITSVGTALDPDNIGGGGAGTVGMFIINVDNNNQADKTPTEVIDAYNNGVPIAVYVQYPIMHSGDGLTNGVNMLYLQEVGVNDTSNPTIYYYDFSNIDSNGNVYRAMIAASTNSTTLTTTILNYNYSKHLASASHIHGNITTDGKVGTVSDKALFTGTSGTVTSGTLPVAAGGTGLTTVTSGSVLIGNGTSALTTRAITNNTSATTATTNSNLITGSTLYYATANINNARQTSNVGIYAPTGGGTAGQILTASGTTSAPVWTNTGNITVGAAVKDGSGNTIATYYSSTTHTHGNITASGAMTTTASMVTSDNIVFADTSNNNLLTVTSAQAGMNVLINALSEGTSAANRNDYIVAQYVNGGTTTITYHRRKLSNIFAALNSSDITTALGYTPVNKAGDTMTGVLTLSSSTSAGFSGRNISYGTTTPSGGSNGDVYIQYTA